MAELNSKEEKFEWLRINESVDDGETGVQKLLRKIKQNPLVPVGALLTVGFLVVGLQSFRLGNRRKSQLMMRGRILAQGFTVVALAGGLLMSAINSKETGD